MQTSSNLHTGCAATLCSIDTPECHESPLTGSARCCATDSTCTASDYQVNDQAVCLSNNQRYENRWYECDYYIHSVSHNQQ